MGTQREHFEARFGPLGAGTRTLRINDAAFTLLELMDRLGLRNHECRGIDALAVSDDRFAIRFLDTAEQRIVAYEFDAGFRYIGETRVHVAEWIGEENPWSRT